MFKKLLFIAVALFIYICSMHTKADDGQKISIKSSKSNCVFKRGTGNPYGDGKH